MAPLPFMRGKAYRRVCKNRHSRLNGEYRGVSNYHGYWLPALTGMPKTTNPGFRKVSQQFFHPR